MEYSYKIRQRSGAVDTITSHDDGTVSIKTEHEMSGILKALEEEKNEASRLDLHPSQNEYGAVKIAKVPYTVIEIWKEEGFDMFSAERSGMNEEEHQREFVRRLNGDWSKLNVSKYSKI